MSATTKIVLVTGGSRGLGKEMALCLAQKGFDVILTYHSRKDEAETVVSQIQQSGHQAAALPLDTGAVNSFEAFVEQLKRTLSTTFGRDRLDGLVNNAGMNFHATLAQITEEQFDSLLNVHLKGILFLTQKALPLMNDGGRIVNISSALTRFAYPNVGTYASLKGAIEILTRYLALELGERGITVNVVAPGAIPTDFGGGQLRDSTDLQHFIAGLTALGRVGQPADIGRVVAFLCSEEANWINGQRIEVTGGMHL